MKDNISPEEKLLRLIRTKEKESPQPEVKSAAREHRYSPIQNYLSLPYFKKFVSWVFILSSIYLVISFIYSWVGLKKIKLPNVSAEKKEAVEAELKSVVKPIDFYLEGTRDRQIFESTGIFAGEKPLSKIDTDIKDINLVGIISGENPQAVIEDKKTQKTFYVNKGQFIGEFRVEDIQEGKIILNLRGQRFELYL